MLYLTCIEYKDNVCFWFDSFQELYPDKSNFSPPFITEVGGSEAREFRKESNSETLDDISVALGNEVSPFLQHPDIHHRSLKMASLGDHRNSGVCRSSSSSESHLTENNRVVRKRSYDLDSEESDDQTPKKVKSRQSTPAPKTRSYRAPQRSSLLSGLGESMIERARLRSEDMTRELDYKVKLTEKEERKSERDYAEKMQQLEAQNILLRLQLARLTKNQTDMD